MPSASRKAAVSGIEVPHVHRETWVVIAKKHGEYRDMLRSFPICGSRQEAKERILIKLANDSEFKNAWYEWLFLPVRVDDGVLVK